MCNNISNINELKHIVRTICVAKEKVSKETKKKKNRTQNPECRSATTIETREITRLGNKTIVTAFRGPRGKSKQPKKNTFRIVIRIER